MRVVLNSKDCNRDEGSRSGRKRSSERRSLIKRSRSKDFSEFYKSVEEGVLDFDCFEGFAPFDGDHSALMSDVRFCDGVRQQLCDKIFRKKFFHVDAKQQILFA